MEKLTFSKVKEKISRIPVKEVVKGMLQRFHVILGKDRKKIISKNNVEDKEYLKEQRESEKNFPESVVDIDSVDYLGGSSDVRAGYVNGEYFVIKKARESIDKEKSDEQLNKEQLLDEYLADQIYLALGFNTPVSKIYEDGKYKVSKFIIGKDLNTFSGEEPEFENIKKELQKGYVLDCLLANWDVVGTAGESGGDNIRISDDGKVYRIDNGGALRFRARGEKKGEAFGETVNEIGSLKSKNKLFSDISDKDINIQIKQLLKNKEKVLDVIENVVHKFKLSDKSKEELKLTISGRFDYLKSYQDKEKELRKKTDKGEYESITTNNYFKDWDELELQGNPGIREKIRENIINAEKRNESDYQDVARDLEISVEEFKDKLQKKIEDMVKGSNFFRATKVDILEKVMNVDGRFKSQFETNTSEGSLSPVSRAEAERAMFNFHYDEENYKFEKDKEKRPIYGYFSDEKNGAINYSGKIPPPNNVTQYGTVTFKIKKERALEKTTITFHDSLGPANDWPPTPASKPHFSSLRINFSGHETLKDMNATSVTNYGANYNEAQYHGQLTMEDVESIHISTNNELSKEDIEKVHEIFKKYKKQHPESTIQLIEY